MIAKELPEPIEEEWFEAMRIVMEENAELLARLAKREAEEREREEE